jgi:hypothetical protein
MTNKEKTKYLKALEHYGKTYKPDTSEARKPVYHGKFKRDSVGIGGALSKALKNIKQ